MNLLNKQKPTKSIFKHALFKSNFWGLASNLLQNLFLSIFFVILARKYTTGDFANYIIASSFYQLFLAFSTLGLAQWFIREVVLVKDKVYLLNKFLKIQILSGAFFFVLSFVSSFFLYDNPMIWKLSFLLGINIIFDNVIAGIRSWNIAELNQRPSFVILTVESFARVLVGLSLFVYPVSIVTLSLILILIRFATLNFFLTVGSSDLISLKNILFHRITLTDILLLLKKNWTFIIIGSVSTIYWRFGNIIVSKVLTPFDISNYEISYRIFQFAQLVPMLVCASVFPLLVKNFAGENKDGFKVVYRTVFLLFSTFALLSYTFIYSFSDYLIPTIFGETYSDTSQFTKQMFLSILVFPTGLLQANVLIAMRLEKFDMWLNVAIFLFNVVFCIVGLQLISSLAVVNFSIFFSFLIFHILQDILLVNRKILTLRQALEFYLIGFLCCGIYMTLSTYLNSFVLFLSFWLIIVCCFLFFFKNRILKSIQFITRS